MVVDMIAPPGSEPTVGTLTLVVLPLAPAVKPLTSSGPCAWA